MGSSLLVAFLYSGLLLFSMNGLVWMALRASARRSEASAKRAEEIIIRHIRRRRNRGY